ncbi:3-carboxyethylcatechol 2,3-dioxygenase [Naumannella sp. ID2617S]|uniref:2,3-dihydroxyphenylpropionate/2,3-dihydroxicinnamic acid 1,2-dioxygenase n=1 Tax=Enemella dayhoffiae TaxID=2016507 RepID=A0A255HFS5_9ACTN|nr:3-carboxyethylcatechol 2,3-dioxygenase [Enemella dayhoffiae]NNG20122.1 3-carboxyethylcatechol 2,3-dioxygenase [Naumannella sp. ID2617S]OYO25324.1 3-(2,3-dihydroxyphenyl)propionate dioxygenase [Enemella dayhoffiae]
MSLALICLSHTPLMGFTEPAPGVRAEVEALLDRLRGFVAEFDPTLVVSFGPDHYNGFFYDLMPPFCLCLGARGVGDFDTQEGDFQVPEELASQLAQHVADRGVDIAISRAAELDHGAVQVPELLLGGIDRFPTLPVFVNGVAPPFVPMQRIRLLGEAVGDFLVGLDERVLVIGSGGLSHDPPVPRWASDTPQQHEFLLRGRHPTAQARQTRQQRTIDTGLAFARGEAEIADLNPDWDNAFLDVCASGDPGRFDAYRADEMTEVAGNSAHEVRSWVAAFSALRRAGAYRVVDRYYRAIPEWIAGFGCLTATTESEE